MAWEEEKVGDLADGWLARDVGLWWESSSNDVDRDSDEAERATRVGEARRDA